MADESEREDDYSEFGDDYTMETNDDDDDDDSCGEYDDDDEEDNPQSAPMEEQAEYLGYPGGVSPHQQQRGRRRREPPPLSVTTSNSSDQEQFSDLQDDELELQLAPSILTCPPTPTRRRPARQRSSSLTGTRDTTGGDSDEDVEDKNPPKKAELYSDRLAEGKVDAESEVQALKAAKLAKKLGRQRRRASIAMGSTTPSGNTMRGKVEMSPGGMRRSSTMGGMIEQSPSNYRMIRSVPSVGAIDEQSQHRNGPPPVVNEIMMDDLSERSLASRRNSSRHSTVSPGQGGRSVRGSRSSHGGHDEHSTSHEDALLSLSARGDRSQRRSLREQREERRISLARQSSSQSLQEKQFHSQEPELSSLSMRGERTHRRSLRDQRGERRSLSRQSSSQSMHDDSEEPPLLSMASPRNPRRSMREDRSLSRQSSCQSLRDNDLLTNNQRHRQHIHEKSPYDDTLSDSEPSLLSDLPDLPSVKGGGRRGSRDSLATRSEHRRMLSDRSEHRRSRQSKKSRVDKSEPNVSEDAIEESLMSPKRSRKLRKQSSAATKEEEKPDDKRKSPRKKSSKRGDSGTSLDAEGEQKSDEPDFNWRKNIDSEMKRGKSEKKKKDKSQKSKRPKSPDVPETEVNGEATGVSYDFEPSTTKENLNNKYKSLEKSVRKGRTDGALGVLDADVTTSKKASKTFAALDNSPGKSKSSKSPKRASTGALDSRSTSEGTSDYNWEDHKNDYSWEKPEWAKKSSLKKTTRGNIVKQGVSLAAPVTHINANKDESRDTNQLANTSRLQKTIRGSIVKQGVSLSAPVTHINKNKGVSRNPLANTSRLQKTDRGSIAKQGVSLSAPVTHINKDKDVIVEKKKLRKQRRATHAGNTEWEKPDWAKSNSLKTSDVGTSARQGKSLALPVTNIKEVVTEKDNLAWEKPDWAKSKVLKSSDVGTSARQGKSLALPVTNIKEVVSEKDHLAWEKPDWAQGKKLKPSKKRR